MSLIFDFPDLLLVTTAVTVQSVTSDRDLFSQICLAVSSLTEKNEEKTTEIMLNIVKGIILSMSVSYMAP